MPVDPNDPRYQAALARNVAKLREQQRQSAGRDDQNMRFAIDKILSERRRTEQNAIMQRERDASRQQSRQFHDESLANQWDMQNRSQAYGRERDEFHANQKRMDFDHQRQQKLQDQTDAAMAEMQTWPPDVRAKAEQELANAAKGRANDSPELQARFVQKIRDAYASQYKFKIQMEQKRAEQLAQDSVTADAALQAMERDPESAAHAAQAKGQIAGLTGADADVARARIQIIRNAEAERRREQSSTAQKTKDTSERAKRKEYWDTYKMLSDIKRPEVRKDAKGKPVMFGDLTEKEKAQYVRQFIEAHGPMAEGDETPAAPPPPAPTAAAPAQAEPVAPPVAAPTGDAKAQALQRLIENARAGDTKAQAYLDGKGVPWQAPTN